MQNQNDAVFAPFQLNLEGVVSWFSTHLTGYGGGFGGLWQTVTELWFLFSIVSFIVSAFLLVGTVYAMIRCGELRGIEDAALREAERAFARAHVAGGENAKWQNITAHIGSDNPNDWRAAIVEADIMLDALLGSLGYAGATVADKLKSARPEAFRSIEDAWNAHKVRNAIAHQGSDFVLTKRVAQDTIAQYRHVFEEYKVL